MLSPSDWVFRWPALGCVLLHPAMVSMVSAEDDCRNSSQCSKDPTNWTSLWYVWLILLTIFLLLLCGIAASCVKFCCRRKKRPTQAQPQHPCEVTVIAVDNDSTVHSTIHSTVTSYSSVQYPHLFPFAEMERSALSPPAYSLYALEMPPAYEEAIKMSAPITEPQATLAVQKLEDIPEHAIPETNSEDQGQPSDEWEVPPSYEQPESQNVGHPPSSPPMNAED
ncbi:transmembrane protein 52 [Ambystoma mexicanum]|uniref:transmembrane protein 52 n=1 Tax=Ambystoma mexicanum TaxID=8296 RepID=UPI0037E798CD